MSGRGVHIRNPSPRRGDGGIGTTNAVGFSGCTGVATMAGGATCAFFTGSVIVDGDFTVVDPARKHGAIKHPDGSHRTLYSMEAPESWVEDFGKGTLAGGKAEVALDADFAAVTHTDGFRVFLTPEGDCNGLSIAAKTDRGFAVRELKGGTASVAFSWRVVAKPKTDHKAARMAKFIIPTLKVPGAGDIPKPHAGAWLSVASRQSSVGMQTLTTDD